MIVFEFWQCTPEEQKLFRALIGDLDRDADLVIADDKGEPYLYRWHVTPRLTECNVYAHIQVASDPARPLHDHPWDNFTNIIAGGYFEQLCIWPQDPAAIGLAIAAPKKRVAGETVSRQAKWAHRLIMPENVAYTMTVFSTGRKVQDWGFWHEGKKLPWQEVTKQEGNTSLWIGPIIPEGSHERYRL